MGRSPECHTPRTAQPACATAPLPKQVRVRMTYAVFTMKP